MIKFGSKVKIDCRFKDGFYTGEQGVVVNYRTGGVEYLYVVELHTPPASKIKDMTVVIPGNYLKVI